MIIEKISSDFMTAYKEKNIERKDFLGVLKSEVMRDDKSPSDDSVVNTIKSMIKNAAKSNSLSTNELDILNTYLPSQIDESKLTEMVKEFISDNSLTEKSDMGKVMGHFKSKFNGQYDGKLLSTIVRNLL